MRRRWPSLLVTLRTKQGIKEGHKASFKQRSPLLQGSGSFSSCSPRSSSHSFTINKASQHGRYRGSQDRCHRRMRRDAGATRVAVLFRDSPNALYKIGKQRAKGCCVAKGTKTKLPSKGQKIGQGSIINGWLYNSILLYIYSIKTPCQSQTPNQHSAGFVAGLYTAQQSLQTTLSREFRWKTTCKKSHFSRSSIVMRFKFNLASALPCATFLEHVGCPLLVRMKTNFGRKASGVSSGATRSLGMERGFTV